MIPVLIVVAVLVVALLRSRHDAPLSVSPRDLWSDFGSVAHDGSEIRARRNETLIARIRAERHAAHALPMPHPFGRVERAGSLSWQ